MSLGPKGRAKAGQPFFLSKQSGPVHFGGGDMLVPHDTYGLDKRLQFLKRVIAEHRPKTVLDFGCGSGAFVTFPLAQAFPEITFSGVDSDVTSVEFARSQPSLPNLSFMLPRDLEGHAPFELVIASEVIEHVDEPGEFLSFLKSKLTKGGKIVLTLPNGYGPFELAAMAEALLQVTRILPGLRKIKHAIFGVPTGHVTSKDTLAVSPHINFFSFGKICTLIRNSGFHILEYRPRTLLCGFLLDRMLKGEKVINFNAKISERLPPFCSSDWMFVLETGGVRSNPRYSYGMLTRMRRYLFKKRWGLI
jgi:SAM-dependent methyltransferase